LTGKEEQNRYVRANNKIEKKKEVVGGTKIREKRKPKKSRHTHIFATRERRAGHNHWHIQFWGR